MTIEKLEALERAATAGPWNVQQAVGGGNRYHVVSSEVGKPPFDWLSSFNTYGCPMTNENAAFVASARNALPALLAVAKAAKAYHDMATSRYDSSRVAEFDRKQDELGEALAQLEATP